MGLGARFYSMTSGDAPIQNRFRTGGFLELSGLLQDSLRGQHTALAQVLYYRRAPLIPYFDWYVGSALELGNAWESRGDISVGSAILNGSLFLGLETPVGPLYLGLRYGGGRKERCILLPWQDVWEAVRRSACLMPAHGKQEAPGFRKGPAGLPR